MQIEDFKRNNPNWEKSFVEESESFAHFVERTEEASYGRRSSLFCCYEGCIRSNLCALERCCPHCTRLWL